MADICALDLSLSASGYAKSDGTSGVLLTGEMRGMARIARILDLVDQLTAGADLVVIEGYSFGSKGRAVFDIAEMGGVVRFNLYEWKRAYVEVPPSSLKMFATGKGNAKKIEVFGAAVRKLGLAEDDDNIADARWLLEMAKAHYRCDSPVAGKTLEKFTQKQLQALAGVKWPAINPDPRDIALSA